MQRKTFTQQPLDQRPLLISDQTLIEYRDKLSTTCFAEMALLAIMDVPILLVLRRGTFRTTVSLQSRVGLQSFRSSPTVAQSPTGA